MTRVTIRPSHFGPCRSPRRSATRHIRQDRPVTSALEPVWIGVDVGGTKVLAGVVDEHGRIVRTARGRPPDAGGRAHGRGGAREAVHEVAGGRRIAGVGWPRPGSWTRRHRVMFAPHLPWRASRRDRLEERLGRAGRPGQRRQRRGAAPSGRTARPAAPARRPGHAGHRHRRRLLPRRTGRARGRRDGGGVRSHAGRARRAALRVRWPRLLGAVLPLATRWSASPASGCGSSRACSRRSAAATRSW